MHSILLKIFKILCFTLFILTHFKVLANEPSLSAFETNLLPNCDFNDNTKNYFIAITLNGKISIIDAIQGKIKWTKDIQSDPLISSTIGDFMKIHGKNGELMQVLPSLDGSLYLYYGDTIVRSHFSAEKLLKSSHMIGKNILLVGGEESKVISFNLETGDIVYDCGSSGCKNNYSNGESIILLKKKSQSVRAINVLNGQEEWHFVVDDPQIIKVSNDQCHSNKDNSGSSYSIAFKIMVPNGYINSIVYYSNNSLENEIFNSWSIKLDSPIVNMWHLQDDDLIKINIFDPNINDFNEFFSKNTNQPYLYLGSFNNHYYIHTSGHIPEEDILSYKNLIHKQSFVPLVESNEVLIDSEENQQLIVEEKFPFLKSKVKNATGYLIMEDFHDKKWCALNSFKNIIANRSNENHFYENVYIFIKYYWKEILCSCLLFSAIINAIYCTFKNCIINYWKKKFNNNSNCSKDVISKSETKLQYDEPPKNHYEELSNEYKSRYLEDFEELSILGKGGFGLVFEAKHKIDERFYAVKRIGMPASGEKRERFMREIRALSKLDHVNIVRYYNAWLEEPPYGWQEAQDELRHFDTTETNFTETTKSRLIEENTFDDSLKRSLSNDSLEIVFEDSTNVKQGSINDDHYTNDITENTDSSKECTFSSSVKNLKKDSSIPKAYIYIQMELCKKETLKDWLSENIERDPKQITNIFTQVLKAVSHLHSNNLIHRDLKPTNIFFSMDGLIKIGDFGLATTIMDEHDQNFGPLLNTHTNDVGTQLYMSPEQINRKIYDHKVDIFSLGIIFFELLVPFGTESERIYELQKIRQKKFPTEFIRSHPNEKKLIQRLMADLPENRPESAEILSEFHNVNNNNE